MGDVLKKLGWRRSSYIVSTKFFWGLHDGPNEKNTLNRKYLMQAIDGSLARLALDYVDLVFCHRADPDTPLEETVQAMSDMITAGKALYWGTSEWSAAEIAAAWHIADRHHLHKPVMEQPQYNLLHRERVEKEYARLYADIGLGTTDLEPARLGTPDRQVQRRHPAGFARHAERLRVAARSGSPTRRKLAKVQQARADRAGARLHAGADVARLVPQESARVDGDHRRKPAGAGRARTCRRSTSCRSSTPDIMARIDSSRVGVTGPSWPLPSRSSPPPAKGMGAACARELAARGYRVSLLARSADVETLARELGGGATRGNVDSADDLERFVNETLAAYGRIDAVVNNTGNPPKGPLLELTDTTGMRDSTCCCSTSCAWHASSRRRCARKAAARSSTSRRSRRSSPTRDFPSRPRCAQRSAASASSTPTRKRSTASG